MIERCPVCAARTPGEELCRRCGGELTWLSRIALACQQQERLAVLAALQGDFSRASRHMEEAMFLKYDRRQGVLAGFLKRYDAANIPQTAWDS